MHIISDGSGSYEFDLTEPISSIPLSKKESKFYELVKGYGEVQISTYQSIIKDIKKSKLERGPELYYSLFPKYQSYRKAAFFRVMYFDLYDYILPPCAKATRRSAYAKLNKYYKSLADYYLELQKSKNKSHTVERASLLSTFFYFLQNKNIINLGQVSYDDVISYIKIGKNSNRTLIILSHQLEKCEGLLKDKNCERIAGYFPTQSGRKNIYNAFLPKEKEAVLDCISNSKELSLLEKAYGAIALYGVRSVDITNLKFSNIDWAKDEISIIQQKTGEPLVLKVHEYVLNAVYDYIQIERPKVNSELLFLSPYKRGGTYAKISATRICHSIYEKAGLDLNRGNIGTNQMRHLCASELLRNGVDKATISAQLGHSCPTAVNAYLDTDISDIWDVNLDCVPISSNNKLYGNGKNDK